MRGGSRELPTGLEGTCFSSDSLLLIILHAKCFSLSFTSPLLPFGVTKVAFQLQENVHVIRI